MRKNYFTLRSVNHGVESNRCLGASYIKIDLTKIDNNTHVKLWLRAMCEFFEANKKDYCSIPISTIIIIPEGCQTDYESWIMDIDADDSNYVVSANGDTFETIRPKNLNEFGVDVTGTFYQLANI